MIRDYPRKEVLDGTETPESGASRPSTVASRAANTEQVVTTSSPTNDAFGWSAPIKYLLPHWPRIVLAILAALASAGLSLVFPLVITRLLDSVAHHAGPDAFRKLAMLLGCTFLGQAALSFVQSYLFTAVGECVVYDLRTRLYKQIHGLSLDFFIKHRSGELISRLTSDVVQMRTILTSVLSSFLSQGAALVGAITIIVIIDYRLTLFVFLLFGLLAIITVLFGRRIQKGSAAIQDQVAQSTVVAEEALQAIRVVKAFGRERYEVERFAASAWLTFRKALYQAIYHISFTAVMMFLAFGSIGAIVFYGAREVVAGRLSLAVLTGFLVYGVMITASLAALTTVIGQLRTISGSVQRIFQILALKPSVTDSPHAIDLHSAEGNLMLDNVTFGYEGNVRVLQGISLNVRAGEVLAIVGPSGAGKSTVFNLLLRLYDPSSGSVQIDGIDLRSVTQSSLRSQMAIVHQETILFGGTIRDNIRYGRLDATDTDVIEAAKHANAHNFIMEFPLQYDTTVGDYGQKLSGGQRQRIAIARAILKNPRILLLDEATNALDSQAEAIVQEALERVMQHRTTIIIAHRLSTIKTADRIAVLDRGRITEVGSHDDLMRQNGLYVQFYTAQTRELLEERELCSEPDLARGEATG